MNIKKGGERRPPRIILYGPPKIGKTSFAAESDDAIFIPTEDGVDGLPVDQYSKAENWDVLLANVTEVLKGKHSYKTLVIDTLNGAEGLCSEYVCNKYFAGDWSTKGYGSFGQGAIATSQEWKKILVLLDGCRERGMQVILLAHTGVVGVKNPREGDFTKYAPNLEKRIWALTHPWADMVLRADFDYVVLKTKGDNAPGSARGSNRRVIYATGSQVEDAGCRAGYELPDKLDLSYSAFRDALGGKGALLGELQGLWTMVMEDEKPKILKYLGVSSIEKAGDARPERLSTVVNRLREKEIK